jgi:hypothetical protein
VLGEMIERMVQRALSGQHDEDQDLITRMYSMIRTAIGEEVDQHGPGQIYLTTKLIEETMDAISDDERIFPPDPGTIMVFPDPD